MKRNLSIISLCMMWLVGLPLGAYAVQTIDAPHVNLRVDTNATESCSYCHFSSDASGNAIVPGSTCIGCHTSDLGGYTLTAAPLAATHQSFPCETCHNPHVSLQDGSAAPALVAGTLTNVVSGASQSTMDTDSSTLTGVGNWPTDTSLWTSKSVSGHDTSGVAIQKIDRGLILWATVGTDSYSFEVKGVAVNGTTITITVAGSVPTGVTIADGTGFKLYYGQLLASKVTPNVSYRYGASPVTHTDATGEPEFVDSTSMDGICQTCHTTTLHYTNAVAETSHHLGETCTKCHLHSNGFSPDTTNCIDCHTTYPEPPATGMHTLHAGTSGYNFPCEVCHKGGMTSWNPGPNGSVQIGFNLVPIGTTNFSGANTSYDGATTGTLTPKAQYGADGYLGENETTVSTGGSYTCSNIYCHSNGYAAGINDDTSGASIPSRNTSSTLDTTPKWDGSSVDADGNACNNCHDNGNFPSGTFTTGNYTSGASHALPGYNVHWPHALFSVGCMYCHNNTVNTADSTLITGKTSHANGLVNVKSGGSYGGNAIAYTYDPTTHSCSGTIQCHAAGRIWKTLNTNDYGTADDVSYPVVAATPNVDPIQQATCSNVTANSFVMTDSSIDDDYLNPLKEAAFGGHNGAATWFEVNWFNNGGNIFDSANVTDKPNAQNISGYSFDDTFMATNSNQIWMIYTIYDNDANTFTNEANSVAGGWVKSAWFMCDYGSYSDTTNDLPILKFTASAVNATTLRITDQSYDKDWNTTASNTNWTGVDKNAANGCGNDGGAAWYKFVWYDSAASGTLTQISVNLTDQPSNTIVDHTYDPAYLSGGNAWFSYSIKDNSYLECGTGYWVKSGWRQQLLQ